MPTVSRASTATTATYLMELAGGQSVSLTAAKTVDAAKAAAEASGTVVYIFDQVGNKIAA